MPCLYFSFHVKIQGDYISLENFLGSKGEWNWIKYKDRLKVTSNELPDFSIKFIWAPNLPKGDQKPEPDQENQKNKNSTNGRVTNKTFGKNSSEESTFFHSIEQIKKFSVGILDVLKGMVNKSEEIPDLIILGMFFQSLCYDL